MQLRHSYIVEAKRNWSIFFGSWVRGKNLQASVSVSPFLCFCLFLCILHMFLCVGVYLYLYVCMCVVCVCGVCMYVCVHVCFQSVLGIVRVEHAITVDTILLS